MPENTKIQTRTFECRAEVRQEEPMPGHLRAIEWTPIVFDEFSDPLFNWVEIIEDTALDKALEAPDTRALVNHDPNLLMGRTTSFDLPNGEKTLRLWKEDGGIKAKNYPPDVEYARALLASAERGDMREASFQFYIEESRWEGDVDNPVHVLEVINPLIDVAYVTFPQYPQTSIDMRSTCEALGVEFDAVRNVIVKNKLGLGITEAERGIVTKARGLFDGLLSAPSGDEGGEVTDEGGVVKVRDIDRLRWRYLQIKQASLALTID